MSVFPTTVPSKTLAQNLSSSGTTLYLNNTLSWDGVQLSSSDFGTQLFAVLRNPSNTQLELIELDPATVTSSNAITILKRGLPYNGDTTADTETKYNWSGSETICELGSDTPQLLKQMVDSAGDETIAGVKTFSSSPIVPTPTTATQAANKSYADGLAIAGAPDSDDTTKGILERATMAEIEAGTAAGSTTAPLAVVSGRLGARLYTAYAADAGANDTYAITCAPVPTAYTAGMVITFKANTINTGACTVNVNSLGAKDIQKRVAGGLVALDDGDIAAGAIITCIYNGTQFELQSRISKQQVSQSGAEIYAASSGGSDTYAITLSPVPAAYVTGQVFRFKADVANTGACTLNVNALGAKTIKKFANGSAVDLSTGDIAASQFVEVIYDGTDMLLLTASQPRPLYATGQTTRAHASGTGTQDIAHGLGVVPRLVEISYYEASVGASNPSNINIGTGTCTSTSDETCTWWQENDAGADVSGQTSGQIIHTQNKAAVTGWEASVSALDATNITLNFGTAAGNSTIYIQWKAFA